MNLTQIEISYKTLSKDKVSIKGSKDAYTVLKPYFEKVTEYKELFFALYLNRSNSVLGVDYFPYNYHQGEHKANALLLISEGGKSGTVVDILQLLQGAILTNASSVIVAHNHPSGNLNPSNNDKEITKKLKDICLLMDVSLLDHLIITTDNFYSFADCCDL